MRSRWIAACVEVAGLATLALACGTSGSAGPASSSSHGSTASGTVQGTRVATGSGSSVTSSASTSSAAASVTSTSTSVTSSSEASSSTATLAAPPAPGPTNAPNGTATVTFAVSKLYIGDTDPDGTPDHSNGWTRYGFNIDGVASSNLAGFCKPVDNASPQQVHGEGPSGIENSWGHNILPILLGIAANTSTKLNAGIASGSYTQLFSLGALGAGSSYNPIASQVTQGGALLATPKFDGTDVWPSVQGTTVTLGSSYLTGNTWVSAPAGSSVSIPWFTLGSLGATTTLTINHAVVSMSLDAAHANATRGVISGVINTQAYIAQIKATAGTLDPSFCSPGNVTLESVAAQIAQASDIMSDGTQDPTQTCDGISIGLGFDGALVQVGAAVAPTSPPNPCADGG